MDRDECIELIIQKSKGLPVIFTTGYTCRAAYNIMDLDRHFYMVGSMGMAASIGIGLAIGENDSVVIVDGDGSLLMNPSNLFLASSLKLKNLIHIVLDNGQYESTGGQATMSKHFRFDDIAKAIGYSSTQKVSCKQELNNTLTNAIVDQQGPTFIWALTCPSTTNENLGPRINIPLHKITERFRASML
ncbi:thiamine pyrophosphate-dependent enzyme [Anaerobacillus isosaccharinicus]|uniref:Sulfopyruvate decarboxylase subunit beta n=1 Tax=Anaerobacillus isosaccharinicus TaxID=1532552 RepID=A0A1S2M0J5_9BACI|nr:thiamine pyrophosphate-dependent enzyme [Anaerobacillus isosaccharinicus]MBA5586654.1 sulfopyruvate decarboxylase subunit beta [Anaerobacillus isosaccharinicus]QOY35113.1 sulfopyruvate decarboxylase subunit beta [Anaerobacillus isosaccharinicus]